MSFGTGTHSGIVQIEKNNILLLPQLKVPIWAVEKQYYEMPELVGFQTMVILDPYGMTFDAVGVFGLAFHLLSKSCSTYCVGIVGN